MTSEDFECVQGLRTPADDVTDVVADWQMICQCDVKYADWSSATNICRQLGWATYLRLTSAMGDDDFNRFGTYLLTYLLTGVQVLSCFNAKSWLHDNEKDPVTAFRVCVQALGEWHRLFEPDLWSTVTQRRQRFCVSSPTSSTLPTSSASRYWRFWILARHSTAWTTHILLQRLESAIGLSGRVIDWIRSFRTDRTQRVVYDGKCSRLVHLLWGLLVPRGSFLGHCFCVVHGAPGRGSAAGANIFGSALLQPTCSVCVSLRAFSLSSSSLLLLVYYTRRHELPVGWKSTNRWRHTLT